MMLRFYRAFSSEMMKMAADLQDTEIRRLLVPRLEKRARAGALFGDLTIGAHDVGGRVRNRGDYQKHRDTVITAGKGALTGAAVLGLKDKLTGRTPSTRSYKAGIAAGAGLMLADRAYRHNKKAKNDKARAESDSLKKIAIVLPNPGRAFGSPGTALSAARKTGGFNSRIVRTGLGKPPKVVQMGKKFTTP